MADWPAAEPRLGATVADGGVQFAVWSGSASHIWVSLFDPAALADLLGMPEGSKPLAVLCLGPVSGFYPAPMLVLEGWAQPRPLAELVFENQWGQRP